ncbi:acyl carrier protein [Paenibacillus algorifonticola]|uniref:acyl carrier protein n=1 Tax=Paenibacillus algorifonticola TaxID=684063 RepID=UPI003D266667
MEDLSRLEWIILQMLVTSNSRTTDMLEIITMDRLLPIVARQSHVSGGKILRESFLITESERRYVSQNIVLIDPAYVPPVLLERIISEREGIGHVLRASHTRDIRTMIQNGWRLTAEAVDLFDKPYRLQFQEHRRVPFKEYKMTFPPFQDSGVHLIEYFNPDIIRMNTKSTQPFMDEEGDHDRMNRQQMFDEVMNMITRQMNIQMNPDEVDETMPLGDEGLALDSIQIIELAARIEAQLGLTIADSELIEISGYTVGQLIGTLHERANAV